MAKASSIRLLIVASGATEWDEAGRIVGSTDLPLSSAGTAEIADRLSSLEAPELDVVLTSPDEGSRTTGERLAKIAGCKSKPIDDLADASLGLWEGVLAKDLEERCLTVYRQWHADPSAVSTPDGETLASASQRIRAAIIKSVKKVKSDEPSVAIVLRPIALGCVLTWLEGAPLSDVWSIQDKFTGLASFTLDRARLSEDPDTARVG